MAKHKDADAIVGEALATSGTARQHAGHNGKRFLFRPRSLASCLVFMASLILVLAFVGIRYPDSGVSAASPQGIALKVEGKAAFATAGNGVIQAGMSHVTVPGTHVTSQSHITVTLTGNPGNHAHFWPWHRAAAVDWVEQIARVWAS